MNILKLHLGKLLSYTDRWTKTYIFTRTRHARLEHVEHLLSISDLGRIAGVCCPNQSKNHHFVMIF